MNSRYNNTNSNNNMAIKGGKNTNSKGVTPKSNSQGRGVFNTAKEKGNTQTFSSLKPSTQKSRIAKKTTPKSPSSKTGVIKPLSSRDKAAESRGGITPPKSSKTTNSRGGNSSFKQTTKQTTTQQKKSQNKRENQNSSTNNNRAESRAKSRADEQKMYGYAIIFIALSVYLGFCIFSYFIYWKGDQSMSTISQINSLLPNSINNNGGPAGNIVSNILVSQCFGIGATVIPLITLSFSMILLKEYIPLFRKSLISLIVLMFVSSISATYFAPSMNGIFGSSLGGEFGLYVNRWLYNVIGPAGNTIFVIMSICLWLIYTSLTVVKYLGESIKRIFKSILKFVLFVISLFNSPNRAKEKYTTFNDEENEESDDTNMANNNRKEYVIETEDYIPEDYVPFNNNYNQNHYPDSLSDFEKSMIEDNKPFESFANTPAAQRAAIDPSNVFFQNNEEEESEFIVFKEEAQEENGDIINKNSENNSEKVNSENKNSIVYQKINKINEDVKNNSEIDSLNNPNTTLDEINSENISKNTPESSSRELSCNESSNNKNNDRREEPGFEIIGRADSDVSNESNSINKIENNSTDNSEDENKAEKDGEKNNGLLISELLNENRCFPPCKESYIMLEDLSMFDEDEIFNVTTTPTKNMEIRIQTVESDKKPESVYTPAEEISTESFEVAITSNAEVDITKIPESENVKIIKNESVEIDNVETTIFDPTLELSSYKLPDIDLLDNHTQRVVVTDQELYENKNSIIETLSNFNISIDKIKATIGPTVTLYEIKPAAGVRISKIKNLEDDIALSLSALGIRIIAPIPGKGTIGIEVPNKNKETVSMYSVIKSARFQESDYDLPIVLGRTIQNEDFVVDLTKMPHLLVAGATGQGKSVGLNAIITSLLYKKHPSELKLILVDPKKVELTLYQSIENHFLAKMEDEEEAIITDTQRVVYTLNSLCIEMDDRYKLLKAAKVRNIKEYNNKFVNRKLNPNNGHRYLPYFVVIIDEFADLIMTAGREIETPIARIAQLARAVGIHLVIATQRPTTNIITGVIKANFPARIAFRVSSMIDSRTILDGPGANQLIGRGDMLVSNGNETTRVQCAFIDTPEVERITDYIGLQRGYGSPYILPDFIPEGDSKQSDNRSSGNIKKDDKFNEVARYVVQNQQGSASTIQRNFSIGFNRAGRLMDQLERAGIVGKQEGSRPRQVLISDMTTLELKLYDIENEA